MQTIWFAEEREHPGHHSLLGGTAKNKGKRVEGVKRVTCLLTLLLAEIEITTARFADNPCMFPYSLLSTPLSLFAVLTPHCSDKHLKKSFYFILQEELGLILSISGTGTAK